MQSDTSPAKPSRQKSVRARLWKLGGLVGAFVLTMVIGNFFISPDRAVTRKILGHDFLAFYFAGTCARTGQLDKLYDLDFTRSFEFATGRQADLELGSGFAPWWNPPFAAWLFAPLTALPYSKALAAWWCFGAVCLAVSIWLMCRMIQGGWKSKLLVPLFVLTSMPFVQVFSHGQNTFFSLALLSIVVALWRAGKSLSAGLVCGLLFYKPQLDAVVAVVLCISQGRRALLGVVITGAVLALINVLTMPGTIQAFITRMPANLHWIQEQNIYHWERHITFKGFWRLMIQGSAMGSTALSVRILWGICEMGLLGGLAMAVWKTRAMPKSQSRTDRLIAASVCAMPLLMPFYFDYDLLLLTVAVVVCAADCQRDAGFGSQREDRWLVRNFMVLYVTLEFGTILAGFTRVHPVIPLLATASFILIRRVLRAETQIAIETKPSEPNPLQISLAA